MWAASNILALVPLFACGSPFESPPDLFGGGCVLNDADRKVEIELHFIDDPIHWIIHQPLFELFDSLRFVRAR